MKLSAVIITFNEEKNIERCLSSLRGVADEALVVDSHSMDRTVEICEAMGARVVAHDFEGHIQQKNYAMENAAHDWVLSLDADEVLSDELKASILSLKQRGMEPGSAYRFNRLTNYCGKWIRHCGWYPDTKLRLWNRKEGAWGGENPHDMVLVKESVKVEHLKGDLLHYSYHSIRQHLEQINYFTDIGAAEAFKKGKSASWFGILVKAWWKFVRDYFFKLGFLDGYYGMVICVNSAFATFTKHVKLRELNKGK